MPTNSKKSPGNYNTDPLWGLILSEIRSNTFLIDPVVQDFVSSHQSEASIVLLAEREHLLSQVDDALELSRMVELDSAALRTVDLSQVASDFAESHSRRFGLRLAAPVCVLVHHKLPVVKAHPERVLRILDCLARAAQKQANSRELQLVLRESGNTITSQFHCQLVVACRGISFGITGQQIKEVLTEFENGTYFRAIHYFGMELCTALHITRQLGGTFAVLEDRNAGPVVEIRLTLEKSGESKNETLVVPQVLNAYTESSALIETLRLFSAFHGMQLNVFSNLTDIPQDSYFLYDGLSLVDTSQATLAVLNQVPNPERAVVLLPTTKISRLRKLASLGFSHFVSVPLVSSKLLRALSGLDAYAPPRDGLEATSSRKLRILVVDDAPTARIVLKDHFESLGHGVIEASDGAEFVMRINRGEIFDLIFCDLTMCHMDGPTAVQMVRQYEKRLRTRTPIVLMTAYGAAEKGKNDDASLDSSLKAGFDRILPKPVDISEVDNIIQELVLSAGSAWFKMPFATPPPSQTAESQATVTETEIIDLQDLQDRCSGRAKTVIRVLESFLETSQKFLPKLRSPETQTDKVLLAKVVHTLKGLLREVGAKEGAEVLQTIEMKMGQLGYNPSSDFGTIEQIFSDTFKNARTIKEKLAAGG